MRWALIIWERKKLSDRMTVMRLLNQESLSNFEIIHPNFMFMIRTEKVRSLSAESYICPVFCCRVALCCLLRTHNNNCRLLLNARPGSSSLQLGESRWCGTVLWQHFPQEISLWRWKCWAEGFGFALCSRCFDQTGFTTTQRRSPCFFFFLCIRIKLDLLLDVTAFS